MIRGVAIETSGRTGSVAAVADGVVLDEQTFPHGLQHAAGLVPLIDRMIRSQEWAPTSVDELYVSVGPGSFTGLRIGITVAKTMALATGVKVVAVPSVCVLAENAPPEATNLIIALDAKRGQVFTARFARPGSNKEWQTAEDAHLDLLSTAIARGPRPLYVLGEGISYHREHIPPDATVTTDETWRARAAAVAKLGWAMARRGEFADPMRLTPIYVRKPEAEEKWEAAKEAGSRDS